MIDENSSVWQLIFAKNPEPACILDSESHKIIEVNAAFEKLTGYSKTELCQGQVEFDKIAYKRDLQNIKQRLKHLQNERLRGELRMLTKQRGLREVEIAMQSIVWGDKTMLICTLHDIGLHKELAEQLREKITQEHEKTMETAKRILRMKKLLVKLNRLPLFFQELWECDSATVAIEKAVNLLAHEKWLRYSSVAIFRVDGDYLHLAYANKEQALRRFNLKKQHKFAQVARGEKKIIAIETGEYTLPIVSPERTEGVCQIFLEETERILLAGNEYLRQAYWDLLQSFGQFFGLLLAYFRRQCQLEHYRWQEPTMTVYNFTYLWKKLAEYLAAQSSCALILLRFHQLEIDSIALVEEYLQKWALLLQQYSPKNSLVAASGLYEFAILTEETSGDRLIEWARDLKKLLTKNAPSAAVSAGMAIHASEDNGQRPVWERALLCLNNAMEQQGITIYYWDSENSRGKEITDRIRTKLE